MYNPSDPYLAGLIVGAVVAGVACGLLPLVVGIARGRLDLALRGFVACVIFGLLGGVILAGPVALISTVLTFVARSGNKPAADAEAWRPLFPPPSSARPAEVDPTGTAPAPTQREPAPLVFLKAGQLPLRCPSCKHEFAASAANVPPWCPRCGADLKRREPQPPPAPVTGITAADKVPTPPQQ